jgi:regulator of sirC expression with transglutaminase-like and TPR domain
MEVPISSRDSPTMPTPAYCRPAAYRMFAEQLADAESAAGLFRAAFAIALHERPEASLAEAETVVENLALAVQARVRSGSAEALLAHLHDVLFDVFGLCGNKQDYYDPANSYLPDVLRTRRGIPISLVLVYRRVAEPLGLVVHGVNAPGHFLAEVELSGVRGVERMYVDPFFGGGVLNESEATERISQAVGRPILRTPEMLARATPRIWLSRMLNNLQASFAAAGQEREVCAMQELHDLL